MRILEVTTYTIYLTNEEFELMHKICSSAGYGYSYRNDNKDEDGYWKIVVDEDILEEIQLLLDREYGYQLYEECNRPYALEIRELLDDIYYELNY